MNKMKMKTCMMTLAGLVSSEYLRGAASRNLR